MKEKVFTMKGRITVRDPWGNTWNGSIYILSDKSLYERIMLKEQGGGQMGVAVRSDSSEEISCYVSVYEKHLIKRDIAFDIKGIKGKKKKAVTGRNWKTGKYTCWSCSFQQE